MFKFLTGLFLQEDFFILLCDIFYDMEEVTEFQHLLPMPMSLSWNLSSKVYRLIFCMLAFHFLLYHRWFQYRLFLFPDKLSGDFSNSLILCYLGFCLVVFVLVLHVIVHIFCPFLNLQQSYFVLLFGLGLRYQKTSFRKLLALMKT